MAPRHGSRFPGGGPPVALVDVEALTLLFFLTSAKVTSFPASASLINFSRTAFKVANFFLVICRFRPRVSLVRLCVRRRMNRWIVPTSGGFCGGFVRLRRFPRQARITWGVTFFADFAVMMARSEAVSCIVEHKTRRGEGREKRARGTNRFNP